MAQAKRTATKKVASKTRKTAARKTTKKTAAKTRTAAKRTAAKATTKKAPAKKASAKKSVSAKLSDQFAKLKNWNLSLGVLHAAQAIAVAFLATDSRVPVRTEYLTFNDATESLQTASTQVFTLPLAWVVVAFLAMSAVAHFIIAGPWFENYKKDLTRGMNRARWIEYALSASTMIVAIAALVGVVSLPLLVSLFALTAVMNLCGLVMEVQNEGVKKPSWVSFWVGTIAGVVPWLAIAGYFIANWFYGNGNPPTFVYAIFVSIFVFFNLFAVNMWLQYKKKGKWADYLYGEKMYMILSLVAKSALAWQVFGGTLRP